MPILPEKKTTILTIFVKNADSTVALATYLTWCPRRVVLKAVKFPDLILCQAITLDILQWDNRHLTVKMPGPHLLVCLSYTPCPLRFAPR